MMVSYWVPDGEVPGCTRAPEGRPAFWVMCSKEEAAREILPLLDKKKLEWMDHCVRRSEPCRMDMGGKDLTHCFVILADLTQIHPMHFTYPFDNQWNAYSPFLPCGPFRLRRITRLPSLVKRMKALHVAGHDEG